MNVGNNARMLEHIEQVDLAWLNAALSDVLHANNAVVSFSSDATASSHTHLVKLRLQFLVPDESLPSSVVLKLCKGEDKFIASSEVNYYRHDYAGLSGAPIPRCFDARYPKDKCNYHILMEDLSSTHDKDVVPNEEYVMVVASSLAKLHAYHWGLGHILPDVESRPQEQVNRYLDHVEDGFEPMLRECQEAISPDDKALVKMVLPEIREIFTRRSVHSEGMCMLHGDLNPGNILYPRDGVGQVFFLDRQPFVWSMTSWLAVSDLVIFMVPYWSADQRRELEGLALKAYHAGLQEHGVGDYEWATLLADYRLAGLQSLCIAADWCIDATERSDKRWLWLRELKNSIEFLRDYDY